MPAVAAVCGAADARALVATWRAKQLEYAQVSNSLQRGHIAFRTLTRRALDYTFGRAGIALPAPAAEALVRAWDRLPPWPEAPAALAALERRGYPLAILSNGDEDMLRALAAGFDVRFEHVFAADQAGCYKPSPAIYALPLKALGLAAGDILHVAGSPTDVLGAKLAGLRCAWSNRRRDRMMDDAVRADHEMEDLGGLPGIV